MNGDAAAVAGLLTDWGAFYLISYDGHMLVAQRRDDGARTLPQPDPHQLRKEIEADFTARPVGLPGWSRAAWELQVTAAGLRPGVRVTALALACEAGADGLAAPGTVRLAALSQCSQAAVSGRLFRLRLEGFVIREGLTRWGGNARWRLTFPATPATPVTTDVGQALPHGAGFS